MFGRAGKIIAGCLFPICCVECGAEEEWWCRACRGPENLSPHFFEVSAPLDGLMAIFSYESESPASKLIQQFKYHHSSAIAELWSEILPWKLAVVTAMASVAPVPLYPRRERERGYNQAKIIGQLLAGKLGCSFAPNALQRVRATRQQAALSRSERAENVRGAFISRCLPAENIILVDDVFTTGATMNACASALKAAGARRVWGFALAKG